MLERARPRAACWPGLILLLAPSLSWAQAAPQPEPAPIAAPTWQIEFNAGATVATGNTETGSLTLSGEARRRSTHAAWLLRGQAQYARDAQSTTADRYTLGSRYDVDFSARRFGFGQIDWLRDIPANLQQRVSTSVGSGYYFVRNSSHSWDMLIGLGYTLDQLEQADRLDGELRTRYDRPELVLGEESSHKLTATTTLRQKLSVYANLRDSGRARSELDSGLSVAITKTMSLTVSLNLRYNSAPGAGVKKTDALFVTGISVKLD